MVLFKYNKQMLLKWIVRIITSFYVIINIDSWIQVIVPAFFSKYIYQLGMYNIYNAIGGWLLLLITLILIFHITNIYKIEKKIFWIILLFFLGNLFLMYLEIKSQGGS